MFSALRSALERALKIIDNPHYHDSCGSRPADHPAVDELREVLAASAVPHVANELASKVADDLNRIADACRRGDGSEIPLGETLRDAARLIIAQRAALSEIQNFASAAEDDDPMSHVCGVATLGLNGDLYRPWDGVVSKWKASIR